MEQKHTPLQIGSMYTAGGTTSQYIKSELGEQGIVINTWTDLESIEKGAELRQLIVTVVNHFDRMKAYIQEMAKRYHNSEWIAGEANAILSSIKHSLETETEPIKL